MKLTLPMPPSDNKLYFTRGGIRIKTKVAERYIKEAQNIIGHLALKGDEDFEENEAHAMTISIYFEDVVNKGWPKKAKTRFKKQDCQNRQKLVTDIVTKCLGIDDSHLFSILLLKRRDKKNPRVEVDIWRM